jgi:lysophospholipase
VTRRLLAPGKPESVSVPVRIYTAEDDNQVEPEAQEKMASRLPKGERKVVSGAKHEIYRSPDEVLFPWWREILAFLAE